MKCVGLCAVAVCATLTLVGCGGKGSSGYARGATYTEVLPSDPGNLNPLTTQQTTTNEVDAFAYDSLVNVDANDRVVPQLAERWRVTPRSVTFTLRRGVTCADGSPLRASDVAATFTYVKKLGNRSTVIGPSLPSTDFTVASDDVAGTVRITLPTPFGFLLTGAGLVPIVCPQGLAHPALLAHRTFGTGPFTLTGYVPDDHVTLTARRGYRWGPDHASTAVPGFPARVVFTVIQEPTTATNLLLSGQVNNTTETGPDASRVAGRGFQRIVQPLGPDSLWFNQRGGHPGGDPAVRRALVMALNLDQLARVITEGHGSRATTLTVDQPRPCRSDSVMGALPATDLPGARAILAADGWAPGANGVLERRGRPLEVSLVYATPGDSTAAGMELVAQWWRALGVSVKLSGQDANALDQSLFAEGQWDAAFIPIQISDPNEFTPFVTGPASPQGQNFAAIQSPAYVRLAQQALGIPGQTGCAVWDRAAQALFRALDVVPVDSQVALTFVNAARITDGIYGTEPTSIRMLAR